MAVGARIPQTTIDLKDAYYLVPIHEDTPFVFTKIMKVVVKNLRSRGFSSVIYLDDILCIEKNVEECGKNVQETLDLLGWLGFLINQKKSNIVPSKRCRCLGFIIDSERYAIELPGGKRDHIFRLLESFLKLNRCSIREIMPRRDAIKRRVFCDADLHSSKSGWGACNEIRKIHGFWSEREQRMHINFLELLTIKIALRELTSELSNCKILIRVDNTTAISYLNKMGSTKVQKYNQLAREIWQWAEYKKLILIASYIPSKKNKVADRLSRIKNIDTEWELNEVSFQQILRTFGKPKIDLFASQKNAKCERYISWKPESKALYIETFTIQWSNVFFDAFPPFPLILKTLAKIRREEVYGILETIASESETPHFNSEHSIREVLLLRKISREAIEIVLASLILKFLTDKFNSGASYGTLNSYRSAISLLSENKIGEDPGICRFMKGVYRLRPIQPKYSSTWDVAVILLYLCFEIREDLKCLKTHDAIA
ncbi:uncharacterized protein LOC135169803 [Diachasmimorpha longicaudata]|uniref:uncharacterized protein LOC135169803 n=1 Tax=Diachasmimorpha longicaudata TaxID=58733 RepID=UPI0030B8C160